MIKGVNRQVIEVSDTGNPYFERALLVVRGDLGGCSPGRLHEEAGRLLHTAGAYSGLRRSRRAALGSRLLWALGGGGAGAAIALAIAALVS